MSNAKMIARTLRLLKAPGELVEFRAEQKVKERTKRFSGFYTDHRKLAADAAAFEGNCYITVNRLALNTPATNKLAPARKGGCTSSDMIERRTLLYLDVDPERPKGIPATDLQQQAAIELVKFIAGQLPNFPPPLIGTSGNGACAFWKIDLPPDSLLPKRISQAIKAKWETAELVVDTSVASTARIGRLLGTDNWKSGTKGRAATIISSPKALELLTAEAMEAFAPAPKKQSEARRVQGIVCARTLGKTFDGRITTVKQLLDASKIVYTVENRDSEAIFTFSCLLRTHTDACNNWIIVDDFGARGGCHHRKCAGKGLADILAILDPQRSIEASEAFDDSHRLARLFLRSRQPLAIWQGSPYTYRNGCYFEEPTKAVRAELNLLVKKEFDTLGFKESPDVTIGLVHNVYAAIEAHTYDRAESVPHWRVPNMPPAGEFLVFENGMLHVPSYLENRDGYFSDHTPDFFSVGRLPYRFDPNAPPPKLFVDYLDFQWTDANAHLLMEEILGDILIADQRTRAFFVWLGKPKAGKSTIVEVIEDMIGPENKCAVSLARIAERFALESAVGKKLMLVSEAGVDQRCSSAVAEQLKRISGNDLVNITRKNRVDLSIRLNAKILAVSNCILKLADQSGALFDRLVPLKFTRAIPVNKIDKLFPTKLKAELPGIVLLALRGWRRLSKNGAFTRVAESEAVLNDLRVTGSPVQTFVSEKCRLFPGGHATTEKLFEAWAQYCNEQDLSVGSQDEFVKALKSAAPEIEGKRQKVDGRDLRGFIGISLA